MPSSHHKQIDDIIDLMVLTKPESVLDVGIGFGKYGFLAREYLELWDGRQKYGDWKKRIDGIEGFRGYKNPVYEFIYNKVNFGNALKIIPKIRKSYDLILLIDVFEHFNYQDGINLLKECRKRSKNIIISTPKNIGIQKDAFGNSFEIHKFQWKKKHFDIFSDKFFISNKKSLIVYIGEDFNRVKKTRKRSVIGEWVPLSGHALRARVKNKLPFLSFPYKALKSAAARLKTFG